MSKKVIFVEIRQVLGESGQVLENILPTEEIDRSGREAFWSNHEGAGSISITEPMKIELEVDSLGRVYLPPAVYPNWLKNQLVPTEWGVTRIQA